MSDVGTRNLTLPSVFHFQVDIIERKIFNLVISRASPKLEYLFCNSFDDLRHNHNAKSQAKSFELRYLENWFWMLSIFFVKELDGQVPLCKMSTLNVIEQRNNIIQYFYCRHIWKCLQFLILKTTLFYSLLKFSNEWVFYMQVENWNSLRNKLN